MSEERAPDGGQTSAKHPVEEVIEPVEEPAEAEEASGSQAPDTDLVQSLLESFPEASWESVHDEDVVRLPRERLREFGERAKAAGFEVCADVTAVDWYRKRQDRFELVVSLLSQQHRRRLRLLVAVPEEDPTVPSLVPVWPGADFPEREVYDLIGIRFDGHPDLTRIVLPDEWEGHPLRKDFGVGSVPVQFKESHQVS